MRRLALAVAALCASACGDAKDERRAAPEPPAAARTEPPPAEPAPAPAPPAVTEVPPLEPLGPPLDTQLEQPMAGAWFEGWTEDGRRFAIRARHGYAGSEVGVNAIELIQIHDALTGDVLASYRVARDVEDGGALDPPLADAWAEALPRAAWDRFRAANRLVARASSTASPRGWSLAAEPIDEPPRGTAFDVERDDDALQTRWSGFAEHRVPIGRGRSAPGPRVRIAASRDDTVWPLAESRVPYDHEQINAARIGDPVVEGRIEAYWSPDGQRVALLVAYDVTEVADDHGDLAQTRLLVRALGPQIELVDAGAGAAATHAAAARLAATELPVARITTARRAAVAGRVGYRGDSGAAIAGRVASLLGVARVEPLDRDGWASVVVTLAK